MYRQNGANELELNGLCQPDHLDMALDIIPRQEPTPMPALRRTPNSGRPTASALTQLNYHVTLFTLPILLQNDKKDVPSYRPKQNTTALVMPFPMPGSSLTAPLTSEPVRGFQMRSPLPILASAVTCPQEDLATSDGPSTKTVSPQTAEPTEMAEVDAFLSAISPSLMGLRDRFHMAGLNTSEYLRRLATLPNTAVEDFLRRQVGLSPFEVLLVKVELKDRFA